MPIARRGSARRSSSAASTRTRAGHGGDARAQARGRAPQLATTSWSTTSASTPTDIVFDPLVFPCGTGDENYLGSALETVEGIRLIKQAMPLCEDDPRHLQRLVRPAARGPRGAQRRLPVPLHAGRPRPGDRQLREARALRADSRGGAPARGAVLFDDVRRRRSPSSPSTSATRQPRHVADVSTADRSTSASRNYIVTGTKEGLTRATSTRSCKDAARSTSSTARSWPAWTRSGASSTTTS